MAKVYNANFFRDFRAALGPGTHVTKLELCDFGVRCSCSSSNAPPHGGALHGVLWLLPGRGR